MSPETVRKWARPSGAIPADRLAKVKRLAKRNAGAGSAAPVAAPSQPLAASGDDDDAAAYLDEQPAAPAAPERPKGLSRADTPAGTPAPTSGGGLTLGTLLPFGRRGANGASGGGTGAGGRANGGTGAGASPLSRAEAGELRAGLVKFIQAMGEYADEGIEFSNKRRAKPEIWGNLDDEEAGLMADLLIARGLRSAMAAQTVRNMARAWQYFAVGAILLPRFKQTVRFYAENGGFAL